MRTGHAEPGYVTNSTATSSSTFTLVYLGQHYCATGLRDRLRRFWTFQRAAFRVLVKGIYF